MNDVRTPTCLLSDLTERPVTTSSGASAGAVEDVVIRLREHRRPVRLRPSRPHRRRPGDVRQRRALPHWCRLPGSRCAGTPSAASTRPSATTKSSCAESCWDAGPPSVRRRTLVCARDEPYCRSPTRGWRSRASTPVRRAGSGVPRRSGRRTSAAGRRWRTWPESCGGRRRALPRRPTACVTDCRPPTSPVCSTPSGPVPARTPPLRRSPYAPTRTAPCTRPVADRRSRDGLSRRPAHLACDGRHRADLSPTTDVTATNQGALRIGRVTTLATARRQETSAESSGFCKCGSRSTYPRPRTVWIRLSSSSTSTLWGQVRHVGVEVDVLVDV